MAVTGLSWTSIRDYRGNDIHIIRNGIAVNLARNLLVFQTAGAAGSQMYLDTLVGAGTHPGVDPEFLSVEFRPKWRGASLAVNTITLAGVTVDIVNGTITAVDHPGSADMNLRNFQLVITVKLTSLATFEEVVRIHVHESLSRSWLTPSPLTIRPDANGARFSIYAEFVDKIEGDATVYENTVGDISFHEGIVWNSNNVALVSVDAGFGELSASAAAIGHNYRVTATLGSPLGGVPVSVPADNIIVADSWMNPTIPADQPYGLLIAGSPGVPRYQDSPNIALLSEGFLPGEDVNFYTCCDNLRVQFQTVPNLKPWDSLVDNINLWKTFIPSRQAGSSILSEVVLFETQIRGLIVSRAITLEEYVLYIDDYLIGVGLSFVNGINFNNRRVPAINSPTEYKLSELIDRVGLPVPADASLTINNLRLNWENMFDASITTYDQLGPPDNLAIVNVPEDVFQFWILMANRRLINERDTALGLAFGEKPRQKLINDARSYSFNPMRLNRVGIQPLLLNLRDMPGGGGTLFGSEFNFIGGGFSKDYDNVVVLASCNRYGGARTSHITDFDHTDIIGVSLNEDVYFEYAMVAGTRELELVPNIPPNAVPALRAKVVSHELGHAHRLGDEYGSNTGPIPAERQLRIKNWVNTLLESDIKVSGNFDGEKIKWRWPRIANAGRLNLALAPTGIAGEFQVILERAPGTLFIEGDEVYLRKKKLEFIENVQIPHPQYSGRVRIKKVNSTTDFLVEHLSGPIPTAAEYPKESLIVKLKPSSFSGSGTISHNTGGAKIVNGIDSHFFYQSKVGDYIGAVIGMVEEKRKIVAINSDVEVVIEDDFSGNLVGVVYTIHPVHDFIGQGTVSISAGSTSVVGNATSFIKEINAGDKIKIGADEKTVTVITDNTNLTIDAAFPAGIAAGTKFSVLPLHNFAELIEVGIKRAITIGNKPMTEDAPCKVYEGTEKQEPEPDQIHDSNGTQIIPMLTQPPAAVRYLVVGLYSGAWDYACGAFHPTGFSIMRKSQNGVTTYCPVAKYILTDRIDPSKHDLIDIAYEAIYPKI